jgi:hypothetical protein
VNRASATVKNGTSASSDVKGKTAGRHAQTVFLEARQQHLGRVVPGEGTQALLRTAAPAAQGGLELLLAGHLGLGDTPGQILAASRQRLALSRLLLRGLSATRSERRSGLSVTPETQACTAFCSWAGVAFGVE